MEFAAGVLLGAAAAAAIVTHVWARRAAAAAAELLSIYQNGFNRGVEVARPLEAPAAAMARGFDAAAALAVRLAGEERGVQFLTEDGLKSADEMQAMTAAAAAAGTEARAAAGGRDDEGDEVIG